MFKISDRQVVEIEDDLDRHFRDRLADALLAQDPSLGSQPNAAIFRDQHIDQARQFGFSTHAEIAAFVLAARHVGQERLIITSAFSAAVFDPHLGPEVRSELLMDAADEALAMGDADARHQP